MNSRTTNFFVFGLLCGWMSGSPEASDFDLASVLSEISVTPPAQVRFREERHNPMLNDPLVLTGFLEYLGPGRVNKTVESPFQESYQIDQDEIRVEREGKERTLSLRNNQMMKTLLGGIEAVLAGDAERLDAIFSHQLTGNPGSWVLELTPRSSRVARHLAGLRIEGGSKTLYSMRVNFDEKEWQLMVFLPPG